jgi:ABC-type transport system involved in multi-copper enzyme maturation permease subunit
MLWYKSWMESRARFLMSLCLIVFFCVLFVHSGERNIGRSQITEHYKLFSTTAVLVAGLWVLVVILLGMGGLIRERAVGASSFTLALPVSRVRITGVRIAVGLIEAVVLGVVPWLTIFIVSSLNHTPIQISQAGLYMLLLLGGGLIYFGVAVLVSSVVESGSAGAAAAYVIMISIQIVFWSVDSLQPSAPWMVMDGERLLDRHTWLLSAPIPWLQLVVPLAIATLSLLAAVHTIQRRDF